MNSPKKSEKTKPVILLAEDGDDDVFWICRGFDPRLVEYRVVRDGRQVVDYLDGAGQFADRGSFPFPRLMLLDLKMPNLSGLQVLSWIRNHKDPCVKRLPVVVLTNSEDGADLAEAYELGASSYLLKPGDGSQTAAVVRKCCDYWVGKNLCPA